MEKTRFYNREDLKAKDVARLISIWEGEAGESFTDYCNFSREAETLEEAIEKVKDGEVDCYDSEQLYESTDDLAPEENNGSATREIYHEDEVVWDNAKLVNRGEIITQDLRNISDQLFHIMESEPEEFSAGCISLALVKEVLEKLGWTDTEDLETNGWDIDYWVTFIKEGKDFKYIVSGSLYYGNINIRKEKF